MLLGFTKYEVVAMSMVISRFSVIMLLCVVPEFSFAQWKQETKKDEMTDKQTKVAYVSNGNASFFLYEDKSGIIVGGFRLLKFSQIHYKPKEISIRVDSNKPHNIKFQAWEPKLIYFYVEDLLIDEVIGGKSIKIQYPKSEYTTTIETFSSIGAAIPIRASLPTYRTADIRKKEMEDRATKQAAKKKELESIREQLSRENAEKRIKECPDVYQQFLALERRTGQPQLWQGCAGAYR